MDIYFSPQRRDDQLTVTKAGDALTINGETFDFSALPDGATLPASAVASDFVIGEVHRLGGVLQLTLLLPHGRFATEAQRNPAPIMNAPDGPILTPETPDDLED